jgi:hypothetical protein
MFYIISFLYISMMYSYIGKVIDVYKKTENISLSGDSPGVVHSIVVMASITQTLCFSLV